MPSRTDAVLYAKGGHAHEELSRLIGRRGELPLGGPDKFLLAVLHHTEGLRLRLMSVGAQDLRVRVGDIEVTEYAARPDAAHAVARRWSGLRAMCRLSLDALLTRPRLVLCGIDGPLALPLLLAARLHRAPFVLLAHNALQLPSTSRPFRLANRLLCRAADTVVAHGPFVAETARQLGANPAAVIEFNNGLDLADRDAVTQQLQLAAATVAGTPRRIALDAPLAATQTQPQTQPQTQTPMAPNAGRGKAPAAGMRLLYIGRIEEDKGVFDLLTAFGAIAARRSIRLRYVGGGSALEALREKVAASPLAERIEVVGPVPFTQVLPEIAGAALVVTPSQSRFPEGFCKSAMEAMYMGVPVVAPDYGPFPHLVRHGVNGNLYRPDSVACLADALAQLVDDNRLRARLAAGALRSGVALMSPALSFAEAVARVMARHGSGLRGARLPDADVARVRPQSGNVVPFVRPQAAAVAATGRPHGGDTTTAASATPARVAG